MDVNVNINGKARWIDANTTVEQLIKQLDLANERIAVEHNRIILEATQFPSITLKSGDALEIVRFVGGG
ncbi:sulfur carrier protein ThiS [Alicyclobacillus sp. SP_1]|uniref:sulfur carrier protein ThiS n=1 Tax=Alicyclobacillus sp. SP_1 TaxID=2942475 RepID=UPI00215829AC|nr:sulfur carrier protein ThiS [Alicyclobacillus sp. SP_1]